MEGVIHPNAGSTTTPSPARPNRSEQSRKERNVSNPAAGQNRVVSREEWLMERVALLAEEKEFTRRRDALAAKIRALPWVKVEKDYRFDAVDGERSLSDLFGDRSQLIVYCFMFDQTWSQGCMSCSFIADHYDRLHTHLLHRDISLITVSRATLDKIEAFKSRMGWTFPWVSAAHTDFTRDYNVSFTDDEIVGGAATYNHRPAMYPLREYPGLLIFTKDAHGSIFHTYSTFARGLDSFLTAYRFIEIAPKGRDEEPGQGMAWLRHRDRYGAAEFVVPWMEKPGVTSPILG